MALNLSPLSAIRRLRYRATLVPAQGSRFQPTGFPDLGAAVFQCNGKQNLLLESAQSMANRLEMTCWDQAHRSPLESLGGMSYVRVQENGEYVTSSIEEAHRINSPYILESKDTTFVDVLKDELAVLDEGPIDRRKLAETLFKYDLNSLIHGVFLAKKELAGGRLRIARAVSAFIEAENVQVAVSGGVKNDHVNPKGEASKGFGNVPFVREEYTAENIFAYFSVDLAQLRGYGLNQQAIDLLISLTLLKIRLFLDGDLRLRTACELEVDGKIQCTSEPAFELPSTDDLFDTVQHLLNGCREQFAGENGVTIVNYQK
ncbi:MAG: type I-U CRISPR-associated RAMP protein Csb1/Cas7u [Pirellulales bacterium]|nr:type I-U CRISPR-associated RAMP protein Csb1/Cas7u [Pirellulales bacterium]